MTKNNQANKQRKSHTRSMSDGRMALIARKVLLNMAETKVTSVAASGANTGTAGTVINITNNIVEGDDIFNRSGTGIFIKRIESRYRVNAVTNSQTTRFILFRDVMNTGVTPTVADVIAGATVTSHYTDSRVVQQKRFHILNDWAISHNVAGEAIKNRVFINTLVGKCLYNGPTAIASNNGKGSVFLLVIGTATTGFYDYDIQVQFNDS